MLVPWRVSVFVANNSIFFFADPGIRRASRGKHGKVLPMQQMKLLKLRCGKRYSGEDVFFVGGSGGVVEFLFIGLS